MKKEKVRWSIFTRVVSGLGMIFFFFPSLIFHLAHSLRPAIPAHVDLSTRLLMSCFGLLIALLGLIPTLVRMNRAE